MDNNKPATAEEFMAYFERQVQNYGDNFFFNGAREILEALRRWGLEKNQAAVDQFLVTCLLSTRDTPFNPPDINFVRNQLRSILDLASDSCP